ncbi:MbtH family NRPS accessory protein [Streptosporangium subroseum]|uniref:MbtH family NRPS accessory protein n=1 Tax=Streptosporangium subroseum TaxID=106412 RepID=UPI00308F65F8|nr:MbtH family protein [Streptosporangium subroseum]
MSFPVVLNNEERYSLRPAGGEPPAGFEGAKEDCLAHIDRVWTDLRPLGVRQAPA